MTAEWLSDKDGPCHWRLWEKPRDKLQGGRGKCNVGPASREGFYSRPVSIGILGDFTESGGKLAWEPARLHGNGLTDGSLAPSFGKKNAPARCGSLHCKPSVAAG